MCHTLSKLNSPEKHSKVMTGFQNKNDFIDQCVIVDNLCARAGPTSKNRNCSLQMRRTTDFEQGLLCSVLLTWGGRILQIPVFSAIGLILLINPKGSENSSQLGSNTGHSGGGTNSAIADMLFQSH